MKPGERGLRLAAVAGVAALIAGSITGTLLTIEDEAWPGRGGFKAVLQISALFTAYAFAVALPAGALLSVSLSPLMARRGPFAHLLAGLTLGLAVHLLVDSAIGERMTRRRTGSEGPSPEPRRGRSGGGSSSDIRPGQDRRVEPRGAGPAFPAIDPRFRVAPDPVSASSRRGARDGGCRRR